MCLLCKHADIGSPGATALSCLVWVLGTSAHSQQEHYMLMTAEPFLQLTIL